MKLLESTGQWRIQDFPEVGGDNSKIGVILQFLKERIWNPGGGTSLAPPWIRQCRDYITRYSLETLDGFHLGPRALRCVALTFNADCLGPRTY